MSLYVYYPVLFYHDLFYHDFLAAGNDNAARMGTGAAAVEGVARDKRRGARGERNWQSRRRVVAVAHQGTRER